MKPCLLYTSEVLAKRMRVCREIGTFKKEHDMTILQTGRYNEILAKRGAQGSLCGMDSEFIKKVFEACLLYTSPSVIPAKSNNRPAAQ